MALDTTVQVDWVFTHTERHSCRQKELEFLSIFKNQAGFMEMGNFRDSDREHFISVFGKYTRDYFNNLSCFLICLGFVLIE